MANLSQKSLDRLNTCDPRLVLLVKEVVKSFDCAVLVGHRTEAEQDDAFHQGLSKLQWPKSKHNSLPSMAVDLAPWPIDWNNVEQFCYFAGFVMGLAESMGIKLRWGGDWNENENPRDETFKDLVHFELA
jgi:peptidoglycan L-alanyl-D-glutamate endopeptidase CwlK